jgi:hypothetical protein
MTGDTYAPSEQLADPDRRSVCHLKEIRGERRGRRIEDLVLKMSDY